MDWVWCDCDSHRISFGNLFKRFLLWANVQHPHYHVEHEPIWNAHNSCIHTVEFSAHGSMANKKKHLAKIADNWRLDMVTHAKNLKTLLCHLPGAHSQTVHGAQCKDICAIDDSMEAKIASTWPVMLLVQRNAPMKQTKAGSAQTICRLVSTRFNNWFQLQLLANAIAVLASIPNECNAFQFSSIIKGNALA